MKAYVASTLDNADEAHAVAEALELDGWEITYRWWSHGSVQADGAERIREVAEAELEGVLQAQLLVLVLPGARGSHVELGGALMCVRLRAHGLLGGDLGPRAVLVYGRGPEALTAWQRRTNNWAGDGSGAGATHDGAGRTCAFYLHSGVTIVEKDRGLDGLRLEALRVMRTAPAPRAAAVAEMANG